MKKQMEILQQKYCKHLIGCIKTIKYRQYADDKHSKYLREYFVKIRRINDCDLNIYAKTLEDLEKQINIYVKEIENGI